MARYQVTLRDAAPFLQRRAGRSLVSAGAVIVVTFGLGILVTPLMSGTGVFMLIFGLGLGVALEIAIAALRDRDRAKAVYGPDAETIELTVTPEQIVFATELRRTTIRRSPGVKVAQERGAFLITVGKETTPVLVPAHYLSADEAEVLRQWART